jgi:hypothetical protein
MDPLGSINIAGDSTFAIMLGAQARGHRLWHYGPEELSWVSDRLWTMARPVTVQPVQGDHFSLGEPKAIDLGRDIDVVLMRQDPPFDLGYITATHLLERIADETLVVNDPREVRNARVPGQARRDRPQASSRQWRQGDLQDRAGRREPVRADRGVQQHMARAAHDPGVPP